MVCSSAALRAGPRAASASNKLSSRVSTRRSVTRVPAARRVRTQATDEDGKEKTVGKSMVEKLGDISGLGDGLGPIGLTVGGEDKEASAPAEDTKGSDRSLADAAGLSMGPISLTFGDDFGGAGGDGAAAGAVGTSKSIATMTTEEWREAYEKDGTVDLWVEEEFNAGSRLVGGRDVHLGRNEGWFGVGTGEGPSRAEFGEEVQTFSVKIKDHYGNQELDLEIPEDRYILWEAEAQGLELPMACRMGCCTACAVKVTSGEVWQPEALGVSRELREEGYALMCVGFPLSDCELETVEEDLLYDRQFGDPFNELATDPNNLASIERDDYALEIADFDE